MERGSGIDRLGALGSPTEGSAVRYGMNPHQSARIVDGSGPRIVNGDPSLINYLDALNAYHLVRTLDAESGSAAAASFKHVSPAGAALAGSIDPVAARTWRLPTDGISPLLSAYVRARDADPKSSFGDVVALSRPVDLETAEFLRSVVSDAVIAPGFETGTVELLSSKRNGRYLVLETDPAAETPSVERRDVHGVTIEQDVDLAPLDAAIPTTAPINPATRRDAIVGLATLRFTQSNSVAFVREAATIGVGAGQQNRVDCVRLAAAKSHVWWLRRHPLVDGLPLVAGMTRQDRLNWQVRFAGREMTGGQLREFADLFGAGCADRYSEAGWREEWLARLSGVTMSSDGYLPFRDNVEHAAAAGVSTIVEPGGSTRSGDVAASAAEHGITHVQTGLRLFRH